MKYTENLMATTLVDNYMAVAQPLYVLFLYFIEILFFLFSPLSSSMQGAFKIEIFNLFSITVLNVLSLLIPEKSFSKIKLSFP